MTRELQKQMQSWKIQSGYKNLVGICQAIEHHNPTVGKLTKRYNRRVILTEEAVDFVLKDLGLLGLIDRLSRRSSASKHNAARRGTIIYNCLKDYHHTTLEK